MSTPKYIFEEFNGYYIQGLCLVGTDEIIKMYKSQAMAEKTISKIQETGIRCKAVKNRNSWAIVAD